MCVFTNAICICFLYPWSSAVCYSASLMHAALYQPMQLGTHACRWYTNDLSPPQLKTENHIYIHSFGDHNFISQMDNIELPFAALTTIRCLKIHEAFVAIACTAKLRSSWSLNSQCLHGRRWCRSTAVLCHAWMEWKERATKVQYSLREEFFIVTLYIATICLLYLRQSVRLLYICMPYPSLECALWSLLLEQELWSLCTYSHGF
jgi:hypothetical protein